MNGEMNFSIFREKGDREQDLIPSGDPYFFCFSFRIYHQTNTGISISSTSAE